MFCLLLFDLKKCITDIDRSILYLLQCQNKVYIFNTEYIMYIMHHSRMSFFINENLLTIGLLK